MPRHSNTQKLEKQLTILVERVNALCLEREAETPPPLAKTIPAAALSVGMSPAQFRRVFLTTGRLKSIHMGTHARVIDVGELRAAYLQYIAEQRA